MEHDRLAGEPADEVPDLRRRQAMVDFDVLQGAARHVAAQRVAGILHHGYSAPMLHGHETGGPVIERAPENHADHARAMEARRGAKECVDRGAVTAFAWAPRESDD